VSGPVVDAHFVDALALPRPVAAVVPADEGYRCQDTVYDDAWLEAQGLRLDAAPAGPEEWDAPRDGEKRRASFRWGRRACDEVVGAPAQRLELAPL
jgi:cysteine synthase A